MPACFGVLISCTKGGGEEKVSDNPALVQATQTHDPEEVWGGIGRSRWSEKAEMVEDEAVFADELVDDKTVP